MSRVIAFVILFGLFGGLTGAAILLTKADENGGGTDQPTSYTWVILLEVTPPGGQPIVQKREGAYIGPDRVRENAGGAANGEAWNRSVAVLGSQVWERAGGPNPTWTPVEDTAPALEHAGAPPYWKLFTADAGVLADDEAEQVEDDFDQTPALLYHLSLSDLPALRDYLAAVLQDSVPGTSEPDLADAPVDYWLRAEDHKPLRISLYPPAELLPEIALDFNIRIGDLDNPNVAIEVPGAGTQ